MSTCSTTSRWPTSALADLLGDTREDGAGRFVRGYD